MFTVGCCRITSDSTTTALWCEAKGSVRDNVSASDFVAACCKRVSGVTSTHLDKLEAESIHIMREVVATARKPVMLYSIGKDSAVMLHLAQKAFAPGTLPFPLLHVDTTWKFGEMITFRDAVAARIGADLIVHINQAR